MNGHRLRSWILSGVCPHATATYNLRQATADPHYLQILYLRILQINICVLLQSSWDMQRAVTILSCPVSMCPAEVEQGNTLPSRSSSHSVNKGHFMVCLLPCFPHFCAFCLWFPCIKSASGVVIEAVQCPEGQGGCVVPHAEDACVRWASCRCAWVTMPLPWVQCQRINNAG